MLEQLRIDVCNANINLKRTGLVKHTWGNVSGFDKQLSMMVIKPSGIPYEELTPEKMVVLDLDGKVVEGNLNPSTDSETHLEIYKEYPELGGVVHTHSFWATVWAQAGLGIQAFGTTHADCFYGEIPCTRAMTNDEISIDYEKNCGLVIVETLKQRDIHETSAVLLRSHGPFTWGESPATAVLNSEYLEEIAELAWKTLQIKPDVHSMPKILMDKHFFRKHGGNAYYGQSNK